MGNTFQTGRLGNGLFVDANGNVGIGTTVPDNTYQGLTIYGSNPSVRLKGTSTGSWNWIEFVTSAGVNNFSMGVSQSTPIFAIKAGAGLDSPNFTINSSGNVGIGGGANERLTITGSNGLAGMVRWTDATTGSAFLGFTSGGVAYIHSNNNSLAFGANGSNNFTESMRIANGTLAINTTYTNSVYKLVAKVGTDRNIAFGIQGGDCSIESFNDGVTASTPLRIYGNNLSLLGGNVGVGTTSPYYKLDVEGSIRAGRVVYQWYWGSWQGNSTYWHMKTNLWGGGSPNGNSQYTMSFFKGYSYSYGGSILEGAIGFHNWSGTLYNVRYTGNIFSNVYVSSDGYVVLVIPSGSGETGVVIDWHQHFEYPTRVCQVTAAGLHGATSGKY